MNSSKVRNYWADMWQNICIRFPNQKDNPNAARLFASRCVCIVVLVAAAACTSTLAYLRFNSAQYKIFTSRFYSLSERALFGVETRLDQTNMGIQELSSTYSHNFPDAAVWPNVAWSGFIPTATLLGKSSANPGLAILPLVQPSQASNFSRFLVDYYKTDPYFDRDLTFNGYYPNATIWRVACNTVPLVTYPDPYGNSTDSPNKILVPIAQYTFTTLAGPYLLGYNVHSHPLYTEAIDNVIACTSSHNHSYGLTSCGAISLFESVADGTDMAGIYLHPIFPAGNPSVLAGFAAGTVSWKALLTGIIPEDVSMDCVIESAVGAFTFRLENGTVRFLGKGDLHERQYSHLRTSGDLMNSYVTFSGTKSYTVTFYPTEDMEDIYETSWPQTAALTMLFIFLFCSVLFGFYDHLNRREFDHNQAVLDTKRKFVRFISHEIRTPLNTVRLGMTLLEVEMGKFAAAIANSSPGNLIEKLNAALASWKQLADEVVESSESAVEVLNDLLNYDKIEIGTMKLEFSNCDIRALVKKTVATLQVQAQQKNITLLCDCSWGRAALEMSGEVDDVTVMEAQDKERTVIGDPSRLAQVLRNLISNALKFTPSFGAVSIAVSADASPLSAGSKVHPHLAPFKGMQSAGFARIAVKDSGAGLSPQQLAEICAEGVQFNANELQAGQGSGLGLFISKGIVEQHGGRLLVESEGLGKGVTFTVELPLFRCTWRDRADLVVSPTLRYPRSDDERLASEAIGKVAAVAAGDLATSGESVASRAPKRILVVDDSTLSRKMVTRLLAAQDHVCEQAEDGEVAVRLYQEMVERGEPPDAILMDFEMPVMNGPTATARLRELGCDCLIVGLTGNVLPAQTEVFREHGADEVLAKPLVLETLTALLQTGRRAQSASTTDLTKPAPVVRKNSRGESKVHPGEVV